MTRVVVLLVTTDSEGSRPPWFPCRHHRPGEPGDHCERERHSHQGVHAGGAAVPGGRRQPRGVLGRQGLDAAVHGLQAVVGGGDAAGWLQVVLITADARAALTRPPAWGSSRVDTDLTLRVAALRARQYAVLVPFAVCLWADNHNYAMAAVMRLDPGTSRKRYVVITLWSQVRDAALAADKAEGEWAAAESAAGRDPYDTP